MSGRLDKVLSQYAEKKVRKLNVAQVVAELNAKGIRTLDELVAARLEDFLKGGDVAKESFIYEQFVYRKERPVPDELLDIIENKLGQL